jgi:16S rRNA (guanine527-N7)-methyltransferase
VKKLLEKGLQTLNIPYTDTEITSLSVFIREIERWNKKFNLVKAHGENLIIRHILDSLAGVAYFASHKNYTSILDIGSGAGFPGIPLSLFLTTSSFTLAERSGRRAAFLNTIVSILSLEHVDVFHGDYRQIKKRFDIITFRALSRLEVEIESILKKLQTSGTIIAYKGKLSTIKDECEKIEQYHLSGEVKALNVPFLQEERHLLILRRMGKL